MSDKIKVEPSIKEWPNADPSYQVKVTVNDGEHEVSVFLDYPHEYGAFDLEWLAVDNDIWVAQSDAKEGN